MLVPPNFCTIHRRGAAESVEWLYFVKPLGMDLGVSIGGTVGEAALVEGWQIRLSANLILCDTAAHSTEFQ